MTALPIELWEKAVLQAAYGFKMADTNLEGLMSVTTNCQKNGKTTL